jgi:hypothetical protein
LHDGKIMSDTLSPLASQTLHTLDSQGA